MEDVYASERFPGQFRKPCPRGCDFAVTSRNVFIKFSASPQWKGQDHWVPTPNQAHAPSRMLCRCPVPCRIPVPSRGEGLRGANPIQFTPVVRDSPSSPSNLPTPDPIRDRDTPSLPRVDVGATACVTTATRTRCDPA